MNEKLENIISGYKINKDDADWLRCLAEVEQERAELRAKCRKLEGVVAHQKDIIALSDEQLAVLYVITDAALDVPGVREMLEGVRDRAAMRKGE